MNPKLPEYQKSPSNHYANFLLACQGKEKTRSPFSIAGPLSQVFCLGVLAQRMNRKIVFDRDTKQIVNDPVMNQMLVGEMPRKVGNNTTIFNDVGRGEVYSSSHKDSF